MMHDKIDCLRVAIKHYSNQIICLLPFLYSTISEILKLAIEKDVFDGEDSSVIFYDLLGLTENLEELKSIFPAQTMHAIAMKANPLLSIQQRISALGFASEVASFPELKLAEKAQFPGSRIVFDSPVKTNAELRYALSRKIHINVDSFGEIERIATIIKQGMQPTGSIGIRITPPVAVGKIPSGAMIGHYSKFGIDLNENKEKLLAAYLQYPWLDGIHVYLGSYSAKVLVEGIGIISDFALLVNNQLKEKKSERRINFFDLGGGLPATYKRDETPFGLREFCKLLENRAPVLFDGTFQLISEFGRHLHANLGWTVSRVEYVKDQCGICTASIHIGADLLLRECYNSQDWHHDLIVVDQSGRIKETAKERQIIAGPLCFGGDIIKCDVELPKIEAGDYIIICDTGAYTFSMWSRYNSRPMPKIIGYDAKKHTFETLKTRESIERVMDFWC